MQTSDPDQLPATSSASDLPYMSFARLAFPGVRYASACRFCRYHLLPACPLNFSVRYASACVLSLSFTSLGDFYPLTRQANKAYRTLRLNLRIRILQLRQIRCPRLRVQFLQERVVALVRFNLRDATVWIVDVAKNNCLCRADCLTCSHDLAIGYPSSFNF